MMAQRRCLEGLSMEKDTMPLTNHCSMAGIRPAMLDLPYPPMQVRCRNQEYAELLACDYCGSVSELSAITQYINNENRLCLENCSIARTLLGIAMAELMHLQKLGELIQLLGGEVSFSAGQPGGKRQMWTPACLDLPQGTEKMLCANIEAEKAAIAQYKAHMQRIGDPCVNGVLRRIIRDEEYHIMLLQIMLQDMQVMQQNM